VVHEAVVLQVVLAGLLAAIADAGLGPVLAVAYDLAGLRVDAFRPVSSTTRTRSSPAGSTMKGEWVVNTT